MTTAYSQRDTEWSTEPLGHQETPTLSQAGCLVTAIASVVTDLTDQPMAPGYLNDWLRKNKGFSNGNLFVFSSITSLGLQLVKMIQSASQPAPIAELAELLAGGAALVVLVDSTPGDNLNNHWVRLLAVDEENGEIMDPWQMPGKELVSLSKYFAPDWTPRAPSSTPRSTAPRRRPRAACAASNRASARRASGTTARPTSRRCASGKTSRGEALHPKSAPHLVAPGKILFVCTQSPRSASPL